MTALDTKFRKLATDKIRQYGKSVTLSYINVGQYNPATGTAATSTTSQVVKAIVEDYSLANSGAGFQTGLIKAGDKKFTVASAGIAKPKPGDEIVLNSVTHQVVRVHERWSGEEICLFEIQARV